LSKLYSFSKIWMYWLGPWDYWRGNQAINGCFQSQVSGTYGRR